MFLVPKYYDWTRSAKQQLWVHNNKSVSIFEVGNPFLRVDF